MNSLNVKAKLQMGQFKRLKQIFCKFAGQSDLEGQGQGHKFLDSPRPLGSKDAAFTRNQTQF